MYTDLRCTWLVKSKSITLKKKIKGLVSESQDGSELEVLWEEKTQRMGFFVGGWGWGSAVCLKESLEGNGETGGGTQDRVVRVNQTGSHLDLSTQFCENYVCTMFCSCRKRMIITRLVSTPCNNTITYKNFYKNDFSGETERQDPNPSSIYISSSPIRLWQDGMSNILLEEPHYVK